MYSWDEIKERGDCVRYITEVLGQQPNRSGRYNCPWRPGSDSGCMAVKEHEWYDHVEKRGGSILDLCALAKGIELQAASEELGSWLGLARKMTPRPAAVGGLAAGQTIVATYEYQDADGKLLAQKLRVEPGKDGRRKDFRWRRRGPNGIWESHGLEKPVLYRLPELKKASQIIICEGEKDADLVKSLGYVATTTPDGAGSWLDEFAEWFTGKDVVVCRDNDGPGVDHARAIVRSLRPVAKTIRVICPCHEDKGDVSRWFEIAHDNPTGKPDEEFRQMIEMAGEEFVTEDALEMAKQLNKEPFSNARMTFTVDKDGRPKLDKTPKAANELRYEIYRRFLDFPRRLGENTLFDLDRQTNRIRLIHSTDNLISWIGEKSGRPVEFHRIPGAATASVLFECLGSNSRQYAMASASPHYPSRSDVFYYHPALPPPSPDGQFFNDLCSRFSPDTPEDAALIRAFFASVFFFHRASPERPLWVIDSSGGQGTGKSTLAAIAAYLVGNNAEPDSLSPITVPFRQLNNETQGEQILKRILSSSGRAKRLLLLDNVTGQFESPELASWITSDNLSGRPAYSRGEESRPNDLTYVITANSATVDTDLAKRSIFIHLGKPTYSPSWQSDTKRFIDQHRYQIIADIFAALQRKVTWKAPHTFRMAYWDQMVLRPLVTEAQYYSILNANLQRQGQANVDEDIADRIRVKFEYELHQLGIKDDDVAFLHTHVAVGWVREVFREERQQMTAMAIVQRLNNYCKSGEIMKLTRKWQRYPHNGEDRKRGFEWQHGNYVAGVTPVHVVGFRAGKVSVV